MNPVGACNTIPQTCRCCMQAWFVRSSRQFQLRMLHLDSYPMMMYQGAFAILLEWPKVDPQAQPVKRIGIPVAVHGKRLRGLFAP